MKKFLCMLAVLFFALTALSAQAASEISGAGNGFAIEGYDTVAYFTNGVAAKGDSRFTADWHGAKWQFASAEHRDLFIAHPEKYTPQYGGYCAYAAANNSLAEGAAERWQIVGGKLYLNANLFALKLWQGDISGNITSANQNWPELQTSIKAK